MSTDFSQILDAYSRRNQPPVEPKKQLTEEFKYRLLLLCNEMFLDRERGPAYPSHIISDHSPFWADIYKKLQWLYGRENLSGDDTGFPKNSVEAFLRQCPDENLLDFVEHIFRSEFILSDRIDKDKFVATINSFFEVDNLPYFLTAFVATRPRSLSIQVKQYPKIIRSENTVLHNSATKPVLTLLTGPAFNQANEEFLDALEDYRRGKYGDCVVKCGTSFESVMKVICDRKTWNYKQTDTASTLLSQIRSNSTLESFFEQPLILIATIRNRLSTAHGAGTQQRNVSRHVAQYTINATAAAILLLVEETNP